MGVLEENNEDNNNPRTDGDDDTNAYEKMVDDDNKELYPGCKNFSKLRLLSNCSTSNFLGDGVTKVLTWCLSYLVMHSRKVQYFPKISMKLRK